MKKVKYLILGAGPSGLALAHSLIDRGEKSVLVLEKENEPGGLCRSKTVDGSPLDIGGGHFLDVRKPDVLNLLFRFMPENEWNKFERISKISIHNQFLDYPFESHIWQLSLENQIQYLKSIAVARCNLGQPMPDSFEDWISWKLGDEIANNYMLPYNRKIWSIDLNELGTYWLHKLPNVSFEDTLRSCLTKDSLGTIPGHASFYYPKNYGYGEVWRRMGQQLKDQMLLDYNIKKLDVLNRQVNNEIQADIIISTIPWKVWQIASTLPDHINEDINGLKHSGIRIEYDPTNTDTDAHWIYDPDESKAYHRILCRSNFSPGAKGSWHETNMLRAQNNDSWFYDNKYAYPINTRLKPQQIQRILDWFKSNQIVGLGRWGRWEHMNSDVAVQEAINLSKII